MIAGIVIDRRERLVIGLEGDLSTVDEIMEFFSRKCSIK